jgi:hypothetical protein
VRWACREVATSYRPRAISMTADSLQQGEYVAI